MGWISPISKRQRVRPTRARHSAASILEPLNLTYSAAPTISPIRTSQAVLYKQTFFLANGGGWTADGRTLPGALDIEYNPNSKGQRCYGLNAPAMIAWIRDFSNTYHARTGRYPVIYTTTDWWKTCTGNASGFQNYNPLWIARWGPSIGKLPAGYSFTTFWQYADSGRIPGDQDIFNGDIAGLAIFAKGS